MNVCLLSFAQVVSLILVVLKLASFLSLTSRLEGTEVTLVDVEIVEADVTSKLVATEVVRVVEVIATVGGTLKQEGMAVNLEDEETVILDVT